MKYFLNLLLLLGLTAFFGGDANGQMLYTSLDNSFKSFIGQTNLDGTGNTVFNINNLANASEAQFSNDGRSIAVSGQTFAQQNLFTTNVFVLVPGSNQPLQITNFTDIDNVTSRLITDAAYKSFSPDGSVLAVGTRAEFGLLAQRDVGRALSFWSVPGGQKLAEFEDTSFTFVEGSSSGGAGVSWSPVANLIAYPRTTQAPANPSIGGPTPISAFNSSGQPLGDFTSPTAGFINGPFSEQFVQHDMFPAFSPDGRALAYFRSTRFGFGGIPSELELRIVSPLNDPNSPPVDRRIYLFPLLQRPGQQPIGQLPLGLSWSPNGTQLSYGIGDQPSSFGGNLLGYEVDLTTVSIEFINLNSSPATPTPFLPAIAGYPEYFPLNVSSGLGDVNLDGAVDFLDISPFISVLSNGGFQAEADCDQSGAVNFLDISPFIAILSGQ